MKMWLRLFTVLAGLGVLVPMMVLVYMNAWNISDGSDRTNFEIPGRKIHFKSRDRQGSRKLRKILNWREHIEAVCDGLGLRDPDRESLFSFNHIIVDKKYKVLYCQVPKVACTNWRRMLIILSGKSPSKNPMSLKGGDVHKKYDKYLTYLSDLTPTEREYALDKYFKFLIVREPFERVLSAYRNKFQDQTNSSKYFHMKYGRNIIKRYRDKPTSKALAQGHDVTFTEFVQSIVDRKRKERPNEHWAQFNSLCHPCIIQYDFIGKYHRLEEDAKYILDKIKASDVVKFPPRSATYHHQKTEDLLRQYFKQVPTQYLDMLYSTYYPDFELFNYTIPISIRNLTYLWNES